jgi:hypothetical protein
LAAIIALVLGLTGTMPGQQQSSAGMSTAAIALPSHIGGYRTLPDTLRAAGAKAHAALVAAQTSARRTAQALSAAHGGAGAAVQVYTDKGLDQQFAVWAVRATDPAPVVTVQDAHALGLAQPPQQVLTFGATACVVQTVKPTPAGQQPPPGSQQVEFCQRSGSALTVIVRNQAASRLGTNPRAMAALVDQVWSAVS